MGGPRDYTDPLPGLSLSLACPVSINRLVQEGLWVSVRRRRRRRRAKRRGRRRRRRRLKRGGGKRKKTRSRRSIRVEKKRGRS